MTRPKVLFVSAVPDFKGGAEVVLRIMLANPYVDAVLAAPEDGPVAEAARDLGVPVCFFRPGAMLSVRRPPRPGPILAAVADAVRCAGRLRRFARQHGCSIVHSNGLRPHVLNAILATAVPTRHARLRTLVHLHDIPYRSAERAIWRMIAQRVDKVILVSRPCYPAAQLPDKSEVVSNGIVPVSPNLPRPRAPGPLRLGFVGRFHPNKGLDVLLDWFAAVCLAGLDAVLTIRGRPDRDVLDYWDMICARIRQEGLQDRITQDGWVTGAATYANLDVLLVSSKVPDPAPLVVPEAMSAGVIVAGYPAGGLPEMIEDGVTGLLVRDGDDLARRLGALMAAPAQIEHMREAAHARVVSELSVERFHRRLHGVYAAMLGPHGQADGYAPAASLP